MYPQLLFPRTFRTIHEQLSAERHPTTIFLRILTPQDTPHDCRHMRIKWPVKHILIGKTVPDAAYQRVHVNAHIAATCISILGKNAFLCLHLPFGTTPTPSEYTTISETAIDLGENLLADTSRDVANLQSSHRHLLQREDYLLASEPLFKAYQLTVNIKIKETSMDGFIDDIINITIEYPCWV